MFFSSSFLQRYKCCFAILFIFANVGGARNSRLHIYLIHCMYTFVCILKAVAVYMNTKSGGFFTSSSSLMSERAYFFWGNNLICPFSVRTTLNRIPFAEFFPKQQHEKPTKNCFIELLLYIFSACKKRLESA